MLLRRRGAHETALNEAAEARTRYAETAQRARQTTVGRLRSEFGEFRLTDWSSLTLGVMWPDGFNWRNIDHEHRDPDRLELALWVSNRLIAMAICETDGDAVVIRVVEADPDRACPLKRRRALIAIDAAANYAQGRGRRYVKLQPASRDLVKQYVQVCGFQPPKMETGSPYYWKQV
jgi:hypothetical protein